MEIDTPKNAIIEAWKLNKTIDNLASMRGNGTSLISLLMPPRTQIAQVNSLLTVEFGTASNIKSRLTRQAVLSAITSTQQKLKLYPRLPPNGLIIYCGHVIDPVSGGDKKVTIDFEPFKPLDAFNYVCNNFFETDCLRAMTTNDDKFGFIIVCGTETLYGVVSGRTKEVKYRFPNDPPKKHNKGGQSSVRFARLRLEKIHLYLRKIAEGATATFITNDIPNVKGLIFGGVAEMKNDLAKSDMFDPRLKRVVVKVVDIAYGGDNGFQQAIELSGEVMNNVRLMDEKKIVGEYLTLVATSEGEGVRYAFGLHDIVEALKVGAVDRLLVWDKLPDKFDTLTRLGLTNDDKEYDTILDWLINEYTRYGAKLELISDATSEGSQLCRGFGGLCAILRYPMTFTHDEVEDDAVTNDVDFI